MDATFRTILPAKTERENNLEQSGDEPRPKESRRVSRACGECQKKRSKCSGTLPCARCAVIDSQCIYDLKSDRRRKAHVAELSKSHNALCRVIAKLRSDSWEEIMAFLVDIQSLPTDQAVIEYILGRISED